MRYSSIENVFTNSSPSWYTLESSWSSSTPTISSNSSNVSDSDADSSSSSYTDSCTVSVSCSSLSSDTCSVIWTSLSVDILSSTDCVISAKVSSCDVSKVLSQATVSSSNCCTKVSCSFSFTVATLCDSSIKTCSVCTSLPCAKAAFDASSVVESINDVTLLNIIFFLIRYSLFLLYPEPNDSIYIDQIGLCNKKIQSLPCNFNCSWLTFYSPYSFASLSFDSFAEVFFRKQSFF